MLIHTITINFIYLQSRSDRSADWQDLPNYCQEDCKNWGNLEAQVLSRKIPALMEGHI
jgi:hypothetical protein